MDKFDENLVSILESFKIDEALPSIIMAGSRDSDRGKLLAGVARAAFRSDAVIMDSGVKSGIENYCLRRSKGYNSNFLNFNFFRGKVVWGLS